MYICIIKRTDKLPAGVDRPRSIIDRLSSYLGWLNGFRTRNLLCLSILTQSFDQVVDRRRNQWRLIFRFFSRFFPVDRMQLISVVSCRSLQPTWFAMPIFIYYWIISGRPSPRNDSNILSNSVSWFGIKGTTLFRFRGQGTVAPRVCQNKAQFVPRRSHCVRTIQWIGTAYENMRIFNLKKFFKTQF